MNDFEKLKKLKTKNALKNIIRKKHCPDRRLLLALAQGRHGDIDHVAELMEARMDLLVIDSLSDVLALTIQPRLFC